MYICTNCDVLSCSDGTIERMPQNCPMRQGDMRKEVLPEYEKEGNHDFFIQSSSIESEGYCQWSRLKETIEFCKKMHYQKIGIAFCKGLRKEARTVANIFRSHGFAVVSVICKTGSISKEEAGIPEKSKIHPGDFEAMCNPIGQAKLLNSQNTDFNIAIGLCVGHDSLFYRNSEAPVTTLVAKDRVLAHNPCGAIYCAEGYYKSKLQEGNRNAANRN